MKSLAKTIGGALLIGGVAAIWLLPKPQPPAPPPDPIRPVLSTVATSPTKMPDLKFTGVIRADASRKMVFRHPGRIAKIAVSRGQMVKKGEKLAWLDPTDAQNRLRQVDAENDRARLSFERMSAAAKKNAVSKEEVSRAEAQYKTTQAELSMARRDLEETVMTAPFDGIIADVPDTDLTMQSGNETVLVMQNIDNVKIDVAVPETVAIYYYKLESQDDDKLTVTFDSAPLNSYPVEFSEYATAADPNSQTFTVTYRLVTMPTDLLLLPGMSATITVPGTSYRLKNADNPLVQVPESAVGCDQRGNFVWTLAAEGEGGTYRAKKRPVTVGIRVDGQALLVNGLAAGERVATAGISMLTEDREVTLMKGKAR